MTRRMRIMLICLAILFGAIIAYKIFVSIMIKRFLAANQSPIATVSTMKVGSEVWQSQLKASGSLRAVQGVSVTTELAGMVQAIYFKPGALVEKDTVLAQLNSDSEIAQLHVYQANRDLAKIVLARDTKQFAAHAISQATLDSDAANLKSLQAQVEQQAAIIDNKIIKAPFSGRLGISAVNLGQFVNPGDKVVTLQQLDPMYVDFYVPQQQLFQLAIGQTVEITLDALSGEKFTGKITTIDPIIDVNTRNVEVEATMANPDLKMVPGMFSSVIVTTGNPKNYLTLPQTAVTFNPYGNIIYLVQKNNSEKDKDGKPTLTVKQAFVTTGETRGDQVTVLSGLKEGDEIVTSGQLKLKNGSRIAINNTIMPSNNPAPTALNTY